MKHKHPSNRAERLALEYEHERKKFNKKSIKASIQNKEHADELQQVARGSTDAQDNP